MPKRGADFEQAVYAFAKALDPSAQVLFDHNGPDRDTDRPRQCDVWLNAKVGGHWPLSILVSCKDHARRLDVGHIGTFCDEVRSTGANIGVIYSRSGFTEPALEKAKVNGIACCRLYRGERADIPDAVWFDSYSCSQAVALGLESKPQEMGLGKWNDIFDLKVKGSASTVLDSIAEGFVQSGDQILRKRQRETPKDWPSDWKALLQIELADTANRVGIYVIGHWRRYRARLEAVHLKGSYCVTGKSFAGAQLGPSIALRESHPGEGWVEIMEPTSLPSANCILHIRSHPNVDTLKEMLRSEFGLLDLREGASGGASGDPVRGIPAT